MTSKRRPAGAAMPRNPAAERKLRALAGRVQRLEAKLAEAAACHVQQLERVRRAADRRIAAMMREIAILRHHEARADALSRLLEAHGMAAAMRGIGDGEDPGLPG